MAVNNQLQQKLQNENEMPLFSFGLISYNNFQYITEALSSLFQQDYPCVELIIADDGSSDFDRQALEEFIEKNKKENILSVTIHQNLKNVGTVQNIEYVRSAAQGEFIMYMAADDALYQSDVLTRFVEKFQELGEEAYIVSCLTAMCSERLNEIISYAPEPEGVNAIKHFTPQQLFSRISHTFTIPTTSSAYRMTLYEKVGGFDRNYFIIEDAVLYAKVCRLGIKVYWIDDLIGARHRDGGISHGNRLNLSEAYQKYRYDEIRLYDQEVWPYEELLLPEDRKKFEEKYYMVKDRYDKDFIYPHLTKVEKMKRKLKNFPSILANMLRRLLVQTVVLLLSPEFSKTIFFTAMGCLGLAVLACVFPMIVSLPVFYFVKAGEAFLLLWLFMQGAKVIDTLRRAIRFILLGR